MQRVTVKVDRITVSGKLPLKTLGEIHELTGLTLKEGAFYLEREDKDGNVENMAYMAENQFMRDSWRLDFNPANLTDMESYIVSKTIQELQDAHFTRLDIAFDLFNVPNAMQHILTRYNVREDETWRVIRGRSKALETKYWGARKSEQQVRLYDKLVEQKAKHRAVPSEVKSWARLELQLRGNRPVDWLASANEMLSQFKLENLNRLPVNDRMALHSLLDGTVEWRDISKKTQAKYRKLAKGIEGFDTSIADEMKRVLADHVDDLQAELHSYLRTWQIES